MVQVSSAETLVNEQIPDGGSITVPAGEVWKVVLRPGYSGSDGRMAINGSNIGYAHPGSGSPTGHTAHIHTVVVGGDTISVQGGVIGHVRGREVSSVVDNTPVSIALGESSSTTVPAGETWHVTVACDYSGNNNGPINLNGEELIYSNQQTAPITIPVTDGDTLATGTADAHIGGFKV